MPPSRRLVNRAGASATRTASSAPTAEVTTTLPQYEPPSCPLSASARSQLSEISNNRGTAGLGQQLRTSIQHLGLSVGDLQERLTTQRRRLAQLQTRRSERGTEKTSEEERLEGHVAKLQRDVDRLTRDSELAVRDIIDHRAELEDASTVLGDLFTVATQRQDAAREGDENGEAVSGVLAIYQELDGGKRAAYSALSMHQRYALNNDYTGFKKLWHDGATGDDGTALPDASKWFTADGRPVMRIPGANGANEGRLGDEGAEEDDGGDDDDDDDDEVAVQREKLSVKCPLTMREMDEPYTNRNCRHTFEKSALLEYLPAQGTIRCPQTGCDMYFSRADFDRDFDLDHAMVRRIKRMQQAESRRDPNMDVSGFDNVDNDDDDDDDTMDDDEEGQSEADEDMGARQHSRRASRVPKTERE